VIPGDAAKRGFVGVINNWQFSFSLRSVLRISKRKKLIAPHRVIFYRTICTGGVI
jgi:hypothetical protein